MSSPTLALLRKDRPWMLGFLVVGALVSALVFEENGFSRVFVVGQDLFGEELEMFLAPLAALLALFVTLGDDLRGTRDLLRHRPLTPGQLAWTRNLAALLVIVGWVALGAAWSWMKELLFGFGGAATDGSLVGALAGMAGSLMLVFALVTFAFTLPMRWFHRAWIAALLVFTRYAAQSWAALSNPSWQTCLIAFAVGSAVLLALAARCERAAVDPDRAIAGPVLFGAACVCVVTVSFFGAVVAGGWQHVALSGLAFSRPMIGRVAPGELGLLVPDRDGQCRVLTPEGTPSERRVPRDSTQFAAPRVDGPGLDPFRLRALYPPFAWYQGQGKFGDGLRVLHTQRRVQVGTDALRVVEETDVGRQCWTLPLPAGVARSPGAQLIELQDGDEQPLFFFAPATEETQTGGLWLVTQEEPPRLVERALPGGEHARGLSGIRGPDGKGMWAIASETGNWIYAQGTWKSAETEAPKPEAVLTVLDEDPLCPEVELRTVDGTTLRHRYGLEGIRAKLYAGFAVLSTTLRPTPFALLGVSSDYGLIARTKPDEALIALDPLLGGGHRWLLGANALVTAVLLVWTFRELRGRGASLRRCFGWSVAVLVAGLFAGPLLLALEPRRAWRRPAPSAAPAPLLRVA